MTSQFHFWIYTLTSLEMRDPNDSYTFMFVHSRIINNCQKGEIIQCPLAGEWVNKIWFLHTAGYHTALKKKEILTHVMTQMDPEDMLS